MKSRELTEPCRRAVRLVAVIAGLLFFWASSAVAASQRPNILIAISDDQSYPHASAYGAKFVSTPAFDAVASMGALFMNAIAASPGCSPSRAALLTGRHPWMLEEAGTHASGFQGKYLSIADILSAAGYKVGYTGKGWGPGVWEGFRPASPTGEHIHGRTLEPATTGIYETDYAANFEDFLDARKERAPFFFWYGGHEPHREFEEGSWRAAGKRLEDADVPGFLPDRPEIRGDILDYAVEIEWFDRQLAEMLAALEKRGELENTIIIVTSDNGMAFPRAKANAYEYGIHVPLAISWPAKIRRAQVVDDVVGFVDVAATILDAAGVSRPSTGFPMVGRSFLPQLIADDAAPAAESVAFAGRERHSSSRWNNLGYAQRVIRTSTHLYIRNFTPERWPAGDPQKYDAPGVLGPMHGAYHDVDPAPSLDYLIENREDEEIASYLALSVARRPAEELFDIETDPDCLNNLAGDPANEQTRAALAQKLETYLRQTHDARVVGDGEVWETYPRLEGPMRSFPKP